jgi:outer membrane protein OmpA-like peptidoglycan-associated protein
MKKVFKLSVISIAVSALIAPAAVALYPAVPIVQAPTSTNQILAKSTEIRVNSNLDSVQIVEVIVNGKSVKAEVISGGKIRAAGLIGPKDEIKVMIQTNTGVKSEVKVIKFKDPFSLANVNFAVNSSALTNKSRALLNEVASIVKTKGFMNISLIGYTDPDGSLGLNQALSIARAKVVANYLKSKGLTANFSEDAKADKNPIADNSTKQGKALNRRVEITVI